MLDKIKLISLGDIMLAESRGTGMTINRFGPEYLFMQVADTLKKADILFGNLENPISSNGSPCTKQHEHITFRANPISVQGLKYCGFDLVSIANNHMNDFGKEAFLDTLSILKANGIKYVGGGLSVSEAERPVTFHRNGLSISFLAYSFFLNWSSKLAFRNNYGISKFHFQKCRRIIGELKKETNFVVISVHWGLDFTYYPVPFQREYAKRLIDVGADLILGHHPHYFQGIEKYKSGYIVYSLGDFIFDEIGRETFILECDISRSGIETLNIHPAEIVDNYQTRIITGEKGQNIRGKIMCLGRLYGSTPPNISTKMTDNFIHMNYKIILTSGNLHILYNLFYKSVILKALFYPIKKLIKRIFGITQSWLIRWDI
ncbi:CapA family protein [Thermodesulfobacteriota bacterium]